MSYNEVLVTTFHSPSFPQYSCSWSLTTTYLNTYSMQLQVRSKYTACIYWAMNFSYFIGSVISPVQVEGQIILTWGLCSEVHMLIVFCYSNCREAIVATVHIISKNAQCHNKFCECYKSVIDRYTHWGSLIANEYLNSFPKFLHKDWQWVLAGVYVRFVFCLKSHFVMWKAAVLQAILASFPDISSNGSLLT